MKAMDLGKITKAHIRHDNKGGGADWFLDRVEVDDPKRKRKLVLFIFIYACLIVCLVS